MKKLTRFLLCSLLFLPLAVKAQNLSEQNCPGAIAVCQPLYQQANSYVGVGTLDELNTGNQGCLASGENNTVWYIINITSSGILEFTITPNDPSDDYDFAVWNATGLGCAAVGANPPDRCNYASNFASSPGGLTGLSTTATGPSFGAGGPSFSDAINASVGQTYILVVDNFSSSQFGYSLDFSASTASIFDTVKPRFVTAGSLCGTVSNAINVTMSEPVKCNTLSPTGSEFYITPTVPGVSNVVAAASTACTGSAQFTTAYTVTFAGTLPPGTYWLHAQQGADNNSLIDNCGNEQPYADSIQFVMVAGNPPQLTRLDSPACIKARVILDRAIACVTVAPNGSDFTVSGPSTVNVIGAVPVNCNAANMTDTIDITFDQSIQVPGHYILSTKNGTDANGIVDTCGVAVDNNIGWDVSDQGVDVTVTPNLVCNPDFVQLSATTSFEPSPSGYQYAWTPSEGINDATAGTTSAFVNQSTVYHVSIVDKDFCIRRDTGGVTLSVRNPIFSPLRDSAICIGKSVQLNAGGGLTYAWSPATGLSCTDCPNPVANPEQTTQYTVTISDQYNCSDVFNQTVIVNPLPIVDPGPDVTIYYGQQTQLHSGTPDNPGNIYLWEPAKGIDYITISNPMASPGEPTTYSITVVDSNDCRYTDSVRVFVRSDIPVTIPSAFSPNGDGLNEVFRLGNTSFHRLQEFRIFNRWGQEVFSTNDPKMGWDGKFKGEPAENGVYNYIIRVSYPDGRVEMFKGDVTLIR